METSRPPRGQVLVVDDDPVIREVCVRLLEAGGFQVEEVPDGESALRHLGHRPSPETLVLLDMTMPGMDGATVMAEMERLNLPNPVVIASGYSDGDLKTNLARKQVRGFLRKPYNFKQLIDCVDQALGGAGA